MSEREKPQPPKIEKETKAKNMPEAVSDVIERTRADVKHPHKSEIFETDKEARQYLEKHVPPTGEQKKIDLAPLRKRLFDIPQNLSAGDYEFEGPNGYKVSFKLVESSSFDSCWLDLKDTDLEGQYRPIYAILDLKVESPSFSYSLKYPDYEGKHVRANIYWLPNLELPDSELSGDYVNIGKKTVYLIGKQSGTLSRPLDLLGLFHEIGHIETDTDLPHNQDTMTHNMFGPKRRTVKMTAYELQREKYANDWMVRNTNVLFQDLGIEPETVQDYCDHVQLSSYHKVSRRMLEEKTENE